MPTRRRAAARVLAVAALSAAALRTALGPGVASDTEPVALTLEDAARTMIAYPADEGARARNSVFQVPVGVVPGNREPARNIRVVVDASGLAGIARVVDGGYGNCTGSGWVYTCEYGTLENDGESNAPFDLVGLDGVEPGDSGTVTYTATADNAAPVSGTTRMVVGGPTLEVSDQDEKVNGVVPGRQVPLVPEFANRSRFRADRVALLVTARDGLTLEPRHGNCFYADASPTSAWCLFAADAAAHTAYRTSAALHWSADEGELGGELTYSWSADPAKPEGYAVRGKGAPLALIRQPEDGFGGSTTHTVEVTTTIEADYRPVTGTVRGRVGDTVELRLGVQNLGPGEVGDEDAGRFEVIPPEGTTITSVPYSFEGDDHDWACTRPKNEGDAVVCGLESEAFPQVEDGSRTLTFHVRIDRQVEGASGTIRTFNPYDRSPGNDIAVIPLDASPASLASRLGPVLAVLAGCVLASAGAAVLYRRRRRARGA
ncbi:hypothetical protein [Streptomyces sp. bgisy091]|uniref:hypothetical protein n=1 Tax=Streptomyces sp. bgisy091 TaxID=3413778 RepID=UPI003D732F5B